MARDRLVEATLKSKGWKVVRIWQHDLKVNNFDRIVRRIRRVLGLRFKELQD